MKKIILDTNFLLIPFQFKVDIIQEIRRISNFKYKIVILKQTRDELNKILKTGKLKDKSAAKLSLSLIKTFGIETIDLGEGSADPVLANNTDPKNHIVATQDVPLKRRLRKRNIPIITMRQKKYLILQI